MRSNPRAFSLVEILLACTLIVIFLGIGIPAATRLMPSVRLNGTARQIISDAREMQEYAVTEQNRHLLRFTTSPAGYQKIRVNDDLTETVLYSFTLDNLSLAINDLTNNEISYGSDGSPTSIGNLVLTTQEKSITISIGPSGVLKETK